MTQRVTTVRAGPRPRPRRAARPPWARAGIPCAEIPCARRFRVRRFRAGETNRKSRGPESGRKKSAPAAIPCAEIPSEGRAWS
jgi:hypothetical protein